MTTRAEVLTRPGQLVSVEDDWRDLALSCADLSYFASPDWVLSWWETLGKSAPAHVAVWRDTESGGGVTAVLPLTKTWRRLHPQIPGSVRYLTNLGAGLGAADHCGFAVAPQAVGRVRDWLQEAASRRTMLLHDVDPGPVDRLVPHSAHVLGRNACPRLTIPDDPAEVGTPKLRKQLRAYARRLATEGVTFRWVAPGHVDSALLDQLFALHAQRSRNAGRQSSFDDTRRALHDRLAGRARDGHGPAAVIAEQHGEVVGMLYGFRWRDEFAYFQSGWRPDLGALNLGTVLVAEAVQLAARDGVRVFDFLRGNEPYKYRFGAVDRVDTTYLVPHGSSGMLLRFKYGIKQNPTAPAGDERRSTAVR